MSKQAIPEEVRKQVEAIVANFNEQVILNRDVHFETRYRGKFLYLDLWQNDNLEPSGRLKFNGEMDNWDFAIYKYSDNRYDPKDWFFPGYKHVNGTIEGGLQAALTTYGRNAMINPSPNKGFLVSLRTLFRHRH